MATTYAIGARLTKKAGDCALRGRRQYTAYGVRFLNHAKNEHEDTDVASGQSQMERIHAMLQAR